MRQSLKKSWRHSKGKVLRVVTSLVTIVFTFTASATVLITLTLAPLFIAESYFEMQLPIVAGISFTVIQGILFTTSALMQPMLTEAVTIIER